MPKEEKNLLALMGKHRNLKAENKKVKSKARWIFPIAITSGDLIERVYKDVFLSGFEKFMSDRAKEKPIEFKAEEGWNDLEIRQAFEDVTNANISREDLLNILEGPMNDIEAFEDELEKAITENEEKIKEVYCEEVEKIENKLIRNILKTDEIIEEIFRIFQII